MGNKKMSNRWAIWIDIEGFSDLFKINEPRAILALGELMEALYKIGSSVFDRYGDRLFIHQFGDGFVIISDFYEETPYRPIVISIVFMRHLVSKGFVCKSSISTGSFADISSCYPKKVLEASQDRRCVRLVSGIMTILPVMGTALIAAHKLSDRRRGSVLIFDSSRFAVLPKQFRVNSCDPTSVDWVHSNPKAIKDICKKADLEYLKPEMAKDLMKKYINKNRKNLPNEWIDSTEEDLSLQ
jgi:hypothetical protein